ncbi:MAG: glycosyltransferase family 4 protein [Anaerolineales bacterium]|nr:glycosyltransferase family 4 protein [Anaerolineales bacterium]
MPALFRLIISLRDFIFKTITVLYMFRIKRAASGVSVLYLTLNFPKRPPTRSEYSHGGTVKMAYLAEAFPHSFPSANLLYAVSSVGNSMSSAILARAKQKGLKIIVNQNGVAFPAWDGANFENTNQSLKNVLDHADYIIYQSQFCELGAERYLTPPDVPHEIIYNPVDTRLFTPDACSEKPDHLTLLLGGNQYEKYRLELALKTLKSLHRQVPDAKLIVTGELWLPHDESAAWTGKALQEMELKDYVTFTGSYTQAEAPLIFSKAHVLLHTKYADSSPGLVLEALACGLPVVYVGNGGVPELVGEAGMGVPVEHDWNHINLPSPQAMADAVMQVHSRRDEYSQKARQRAVELFSLETFVARHKEMFEKVLGDSHF